MAGAPTTTPAGALAVGDRLAVLRWITHDYWPDANGWIHGPTVVHQPIPEAFTQPAIVPVLAILHSNAAPALTRWESLIAYWRRSDITGEAHFQVAGVNATGDKAGRLVQAMPVTVRADCNYKANRFLQGGRYVGAVSYETEDRGAATLDQTPWPVAQLGPIISSLTCIAVGWGLWCTAPAAWNDRGIGHHVQFTEWSSFTGKTCPGAARIRQMDGVRAGVATMLAEYSKATGWQCGKGFPS